MRLEKIDTATKMLTRARRALFSYRRTVKQPSEFDLCLEPKADMATKFTSADTFRAVAARYQKRANETTQPALRDAYRQLTVGYTRLAGQQEESSEGHALDRKT